MAVWPVSLPQYMHVGMQDTRQETFLRSPNSNGPAKQRRRFTKAARTLKGTMHFTKAQRATFETFYQSTISDGADEFDFTDPSDGATVSCRFVKPPAFRYIVGGASGAELQEVTLEFEVI